MIIEFIDDPPAEHDVEVIFRKLLSLKKKVLKHFRQRVSADPPVQPAPLSRLEDTAT